MPERAGCVCCTQTMKSKTHLSVSFAASSPRVGAFRSLSLRERWHAVPKRAGCDVRKGDIVPKKNNKLLPLAKELRRAMTPEERHLWYDFLRSYPIKIYKQRIIDRFVVDFYCHKAKLVIELDGSQHYTDDGMAYDAERTALLNSCELHVIRFSNSDVNTNFENVCAAIDEIIKARC